MKCKNCRGTGERHTINWETGKVYIVQGEKCPVCGGKGDIEQTNEEWLDTLSTEEKAVFMTLYTLRREAVADKTFYETVTKSANEAMELTVGTKRIKAYKELLAWLKGEHKE